MSTELARAHILGQKRLRDLTGRAVQAAWASLPGYDEEHVDQFLERAVPLVVAGQRQSVSFTEAYLARAVGRTPLGINPEDVYLPEDRGRRGVTLEEAYRRPFVKVWTALSNDVPWSGAVAAGLARAQGMAAWDVQSAMRETLVAVGQEDDQILGYQRVPDGNACAFCVLVSGQRYTTSDLMEIHNHCGCGVDVITGENRSQFTGNAKNDLPAGVAVHEHGELGPVLADPAHDFTQL